MAGLTRKKVKVRSKSGKVYQRSVMVKSGAQVTRKSTGQLTAGKALRKYGLGALGLGAGAGASMMGGAMLGMHAGLRAAGRKQEHKSAFAHAGAGAGLLAGTAGAVKLLRGARVERANRDITKHGTTGARLALGAAAGLGHLATAAGMMYAHSRGRSAMTNRVRDRLASREVTRV